jgi:tetratricopeptide (TPR) repeat protein
MTARALACGICLLAIAIAGGRFAAASEDFSGAPDQREPIFDGLGDIHHPVTAATPYSQQFFDQGLSFIYAFNLEEALGSFREAARRDPNMPMAYWGIALALGPNINAPPDADRGKEAAAAITKARSLESSANEAECGYIEALAKRYPPSGIIDDAHARAYADAMRALAHRYPDDADANTLFAESMMDLHPWALWTNDGKPVPGTEEIVATLEATVARHPNHTGANHYYIHAVEASKTPERALPEAERLPRLARGAGHLVHMPSHVYYRIGRYHEAAEANAHAIRVDRAYIRERGDKSEYAIMYYPHNIHFMWAAYLMEGNRRDAARAARELAAAVPFDEMDQVPEAEAMTSPMILTEVRFAEWKAILEEGPPPPDLAYSNAIWHYGRGMAFAAENKPDDAANEWVLLEKSRAAIPANLEFGNESASQLAQIASFTLKGEHEISAGKADAGLNHLKAAVAAQDALSYDEPPPWYSPVRQIYGVELLKLGRAREAEEVFRADLAQYPENGWSLHGLATALRARGDAQQAEAFDARFNKAWAHADVTLPDPSQSAATVSR